MYSQMAKFHPNALFALICFFLAIVFVLIALIVILLALEFLLSCTPFSNQVVHNIKTVHVLGVAVFPFLDLCHQARKLPVFPLEPLHVQSDLFLRAKTRVCSGTCFEISETDILAVIPLQFTGQGPLCEALELEQLLEVLFEFCDGRRPFEVCRWGPKVSNFTRFGAEKKESRGQRTSKQETQLLFPSQRFRLLSFIKILVIGLQIPPSGIGLGCDSISRHLNCAMGEGGRVDEDRGGSSCEIAANPAQRAFMSTSIDPCQDSEQL